MLQGKVMWCLAATVALVRASTCQTLNGSNGFAINGIAAGDSSGESVSSAGDVNGDGFDDLIIGARGADPNGIPLQGKVMWCLAATVALVRASTCHAQRQQRLCD
jgi:hypothetical protein